MKINWAQLEVHILFLSCIWATWLSDMIDIFSSRNSHQPSTLYFSCLWEHLYRAPHNMPPLNTKDSHGVFIAKAFIHQWYSQNGDSPFNQDNNSNDKWRVVFLLEYIKPGFTLMQKTKTPFNGCQWPRKCIIGAGSFDWLVASPLALWPKTLPCGSSVCSVGQVPTELVRYKTLVKILTDQCQPCEHLCTPFNSAGLWKESQLCQLVPKWPACQVVFLINFPSHQTITKATNIIGKGADFGICYSNVNKGFRKCKIKK